MSETRNKITTTIDEIYFTTMSLSKYKIKEMYEKQNDDVWTVDMAPLQPSVIHL